MENESRIVNAVADKIKRGRSFLVSAHVNLEGDALGSGLALYFLLKKLGKKAVVCNNDPTPAIYRFLPGHEVIRHVLHENESFDAALIADCSDSSRTGRIKDYLSRAKCIINIDHHVSNTFFGDINWVDAAASSACEMLYKLCRKLGVMDKDIALCLYTGIFTDSGKFTYASTTADTHRIVSDLLKYKVEPFFVQEKLISTCEPEDLVFIGRLMTHLKLDSKKKACWCLICEWEEKAFDTTEVIFSVMRLLKGVEVFVLFKQVGKDKVRVNFRSRSHVDVNHIAQFFGGGGHKRASGTTVDGNLPAVERKVMAFVKHYTNTK